MKKGFTLIEMIAVIIIISVLMITIIPSVLNQLSNKKEEISDLNKQAIYAATSNYLDYNKTTYPLNYGRAYCIKLETLVNAGEISSPIKDFKTGNEISLDKVVKITINIYNDPEYSVVEADDCLEK
ncbi:MAG: prepilin-type N-terminal cleavage/methylation domain-containing protein [Bacilli bacterium]|nr:prepilin-type N-terminal cleavage/methylation domain-containing protein [Bacilli bacterium]